MSLKALVQLNPQVKRNVIPGYLKDYVVKIPTEKKAFFDLYRSTILASVVPSQRPAPLTHRAAFASHHRRKVVHQVSRGEVLGSIAAKYQVRVSDIRRWNRLRSLMIKIKQPLVIWVAEKSVVKAHLTEDRTTSGKVNPSSARSL